MGKEHAKAQITVPAARVEREASQRTPQHHEQPRLVAADGADFAWPEGKPEATQTETPVFLRGQMERGMAVVVARELQQENAELAVKAVKFDKQRQQQRDSYYRNKEADLEGWRERERVRRADYRARKRREAQEEQKTADKTN